MTHPSTSLSLGAAALVVASLVAPAIARADYYDYGGSSGKDSWEKTRFEGAVGGLVGGQSVGWVHGTAGGLHLDAGLRLDRLYLYGEYDFMSVGQDSYDVDEPVRGFMHRGGVSARYSVATVGGKRDIPVRGDFWIEAGLGDQVINWHEGGRLHRPDVSMGLGGQASFRLGRDKPKFLGFYYALKVTVADAPPRKDNQPTCAGPCDYPTPPSPYDVGIFFNFGVPFGR